MSAAAQYLLDTTVLIDLSRGIAGIREQVDALSIAGAELGICAVNVAEFASGIPGDQMVRWSRLLGGLQYWDISREAALLAGAYRHRLARQGMRPALPDALIAAVSVVVGATILTGNARHFEIIPGVRARSLRR